MTTLTLPLDYAAIERMDPPIATQLGVPVSTTHTITGAIVGVGSVTNASAVRWGVAGRIVWAWVLTIPCSASIAAATWALFHAFGA